MKTNTSNNPYSVTITISNLAPVDIFKFARFQVRVLTPNLIDKNCVAVYNSGFMEYVENEGMGLRWRRLTYS